MGENQSILDQIEQEVGQLTDEQLAAAAARILDRQAQQKARVTPEMKARALEASKRKREMDKRILALAKAKGLTVG